MLVTLIELMGLVILSSVLQKSFKIPSPITLMTVISLFIIFNIKFFTLSNEEFDNLVLITLPLLITADALKLRWEDLVKNCISLFWVAVITVLMSIGAGVLINDFVLFNYTLPIAAVIVLFSMVSATDPITVSSIFSSFKVPHKLKIIAEGESLFNDATALIVFSIGVAALNNPENITFSFVALKSISVIFGAVIVGLLIGYLTTFLLKVSEEALVETTIILFSAYSSYMISEHFHFSGILSVIITVLIANKVIQKIINNEDEHIKEANKTRNIRLLKYAMSTKDNQQTVLKSLDFISMFASAILFVSIATVADFHKLWHYKYEILAVFLATTIIRGLMMLKFALISNKVKYMLSIKKHWWAVLTFAGSKGALSILMVHLLPSSFEYKELFENIIIGTIFLSTFIYALILAIIFAKNKLRFEKECEEDLH